MKKSITFIVAASILMLNACSTSSANSEKNESGVPAARVSSPLNESTAIYDVDTAMLATSDVYYQCPMHKDVISDQPGKCPKCGMVLVAKKKAS